MGWYSSGSAITPYDYVLQKQLTKYNERPLFLLMDPAASGGRDLPLTLYEERTHVVADQASSEFVKTAYTVQADEAERIVVTYAAKVVNQEEAGSAGRRQWPNKAKRTSRTKFRSFARYSEPGSSCSSVLLCCSRVAVCFAARSVISHYTTMLKSVESLKSRVSALHQFLLDVQSGKVDMARQQDQQILRDIKGLCHRLPVMTQHQFRSDLLAVRNNTPHQQMQTASQPGARTHKMDTGCGGEERIRCTRAHSLSASVARVPDSVVFAVHRSTTMLCW